MDKVEIDTANVSSLLKRGELVLFVGAGVSMGAGFPGWTALARPLADKIGFALPPRDDLVTADHLLTTFQYYENEFGRQNLIAVLKEALDTGITRLTKVHRLLASLRVSTVFTTNYDDLIELAYRRIGSSVNVIVNEAEIAFWSTDRVQLVKLCGDLSRPESIAITKRDFSTYATTRPRLYERLRSTLETKTPLFLGYSLQDPFVNQVWDQIGIDFARLRRAGFAVLFDTDNMQISDLAARGIHVIGLSSRNRNKSTVLASWLESIGP